MPSGEAAIAAVCSSQYICSGYSAGDGGDAVARGGSAAAAATACELETVTAGCANCACLMRGRRGRRAAQCCRAALYAPRLRRLSEPTDKAAAMREREFFAKKTALLGRQASRPG
jgi:hypothetical protein